MQAIVDYNASILERIDALLVQLTDEDYARPSRLLFGSSIGQHFRHILEFYGCLLMRDGASFSYDRRTRDPRLEQEVSAARGSCRASILLLQKISADHALEMESELPDTPLWSAQRTTLKRELAYLADHGVHHLAMIRIALEQELPGIRFPEHLGVAASTRNHRSR
ncbi:MAG: DinB family protein [Flavobacteriales bacterium]|nr:DinB family protein [Flavobacteriales bacterium]